jgi:hypothetical protein
MVAADRCVCGTQVPLSDDETAILGNWGAGPFCEPCAAQDAAAVGLAVDQVAAEKARRRTLEAPGILKAGGVPERVIGEIRQMERLEHQIVARAAVAAWGRGQFGTRTLDGQPVRSTVSLFGDNRSGKTLLAGFALGIAAIAGQPVTWVRASRVAGAAMSDDDRDRSATDRLLAAQARRCLVVDDIDKGRTTSYGAGVLFDLIDGWHAQGWPLLVTGNHDLDWIARELPQHGEAIAGRLEEGTVLTVARPGSDAYVAQTAT